MALSQVGAAAHQQRAFVALLRRTMETDVVAEARCAVPLLVNVEVGASWGTMAKYE